MYIVLLYEFFTNFRAISWFFIELRPESLHFFQWNKSFKVTTFWKTELYLL